MKAKRVPQSGMARGLAMGRLAGSLVGGAVGEGFRRWRQGESYAMSELWLTPGNARKVAQKLSEMRGAAMKVGQLLSMEAGEFLPAEIAQLLDSLRKDAHVTPLGEVAAILEANWGEGWSARFKRFSFTPLASGSIGQVHEAVTRDGRHLAIKVLHPGVRRSIDSDIDNVALLLRLPSLLPRHIDVAPLLAEAKRQLHLETDYRHEASQLRDYARQLGDSPGFAMPTLLDEWCSDEVLCMDFLAGESLETLFGAPQQKRDEVATRMLGLTFREVLHWGLVQTDPNFANYRYASASDTLQLLDFGAVRRYPEEFGRAFAGMLRAAANADHDAIFAAASDLGYLKPGDAPDYGAAVLRLILLATEPVRHHGAFDFGTTDLASRIAAVTLELRANQAYGSLPPPQILFLHRKVGGMYLLLRRLGARVDVPALLQHYLDENPIAGGSGA